MFEELEIQGIIQENPYLSRSSAKYIHSVLAMVVTPNPMRGVTEMTIECNDIVIGRLRRGDKAAHSAYQEYIKKYDPTYKAAIKEGRDPVVALAMAFPLGGEVARQYVEMILLLNGTGS